MADPQTPALTNEQLAQQMSGYGDQLSQLQQMFNSGNVVMAGDDGFGRMSGGYNQYGSVRPDTILMRDKDGNLDSRLTQTMSPEIQALRDKAMAPGDSEAAKIARQQLAGNMSGARDQLQAQGASALSGGMRNLAMRGGASTGARERMNRDISRGLMSGTQNLGKQQALSNLGISAQDEAMKNQLLGQTGQIAQQIQEGNIGRLQQDIYGQNLAQQKMYEEDMRAKAAQASGNAQAAAASCFLGDTEFKMADGSMKAIQSINLNDEMYEGGKVFFKTEALTTDLYSYDGKIYVTGTHAVKEDGKWIRVADSPLAKKCGGEWVIYSLANENHIMLTEDIVFSDFFETDKYEEYTIEESLEALNR